jgi:hypothetical protein
MKRTFRPKLAQLVAVTATFFSSCSYNDFPVPVDCAASNLALVIDAKQDPTLCNSIDGSITVSATGGEGPFDFSINAGEFQTSPVFANLGPGSYTVTVKGIKGCESSQIIELASPSSTLVAVATTSPDSDCFSDNGSITVTASLGKPPYKYQFGTGTFVDVRTFPNLKFGNYTVTVKDADDCPKLLNITVPRGNSDISYVNDVAPLLETKCNIKGCHNGDLGSSRDWRTYSTTKANAASIKSRTVAKSMPPGTPLTQNEIDEITCWVDDGAANN